MLLIYKKTYFNIRLGSVKFKNKLLTSNVSNIRLHHLQTIDYLLVHLDMSPMIYVIMPEALQSD